MSQELDARLLIAAILLVLSGAVSLYTALRRWSASSSNARLMYSASVFMALLALYLVREQIHDLLNVSQTDTIASRFIPALLWLSFAFLITRVLDFLLWRGLLTENGKLLVPKIFVYGSNFLVLLITGLIFFQVELGKDVTLLLTTSGILIVAIGYLAKAPFESAFAGFFLNIAPAFRKGDYVEISDWRGNVSIFGIIEDIGWKRVTVISDEGTRIFINNIDVAEKIVTNFSTPNSERLYKLEIALDFKVSVSQGTRLLESALSELDDTIKTYRVSAARLSEKGVNYVVRYWRREKIENEQALESIISALYYKIQKEPSSNFGFDQDSKIHKAFERRVDAAIAQRSQLLRTISIFSALSDEEISDLAETCVPRVFGPPERIICQGDAGDSMFAVVEGHVKISLKSPGQEDIELATEGPGHYFGEMALLTGQPRGATVRAIDDVLLLEIPKSGLLKILENEPSLAGQIASSVAARQTENEALVMGAHERSQLSARTKSLADAIRSRVLVFFGLKEKGEKAPRN